MPLTSLQRDSGLIAILALDHNRELAELLGLDLQLPDNLEVLNQVNQSLFALSQATTGVILEPVYTLALLAQQPTPAALLIALEQDKEVLPENLPLLFPNFSLEEIANNYAAAKLSLNYYPGEAKAIEKKQLLAEIREYSRILGQNFLLQLSSQPPTVPVSVATDSKTAASTNSAADITDDATSTPEQLLVAVQELRGLCDLLVVPNPADPLAMATIVSELDQPCLVTNHPADSYEVFKEQFRMAMDNGARGYCLGPVLWQDLAQFRAPATQFDQAAVTRFIETTVRDRVLELNRIAEESLDVL